MNLAELGWSPVFEAHFEPFERRGLSPARVVREERLTYEICGEHEAMTAVISGKLRFEAASAADLPAVGDWVAVEPRPAEGRATIHAVLPRHSVFARRAAGTGGAQQVAAANIDHVFLVSGLDGDFNPRRIERYLTVAWNSGAAPVVVLNKADLESHADADAGVTPARPAPSSR
ncbi:MAG: GTPase RsgA, partial [Planctomycetes bacterium]|nr:GTPase RsgA [Planctomycetota bacterium]